MRIAFLTDEFYPTFGANSLLVKNICEELVSRGNGVYVLPYSYQAELPKEELFEGMTVVRKLPSDGKEAFKSQLRSKCWGTAAKILFKYFYQRCVDSNNLKLKQNYAAEQFLKSWITENKINCIVSINCSFESSLPLLSLRNKGALDCKWIWYMIDPFESHDYYKSLMPQEKLRKWQREVMQACDSVIMTEEIYRDTCLWETFQDINKPVILKFPKMIALEQQESRPKFDFPKQNINVLCTGTRDDEVRDSTYTLALSKMIPEANFHFVGVNWATHEVKNEDNLYFYPRQPKEVIRNMQDQADFLLNIGNKNPNQIPSKVLEYINTGKPIINVYKTEGCPTLRLLAGYNALHISEEETLSQSSERLREYLHQGHAILPQEEILERYQEYTPKYFVDRFLQLL